MDSITQAALGAAVGEAVLGRKIGNKAPLWGAFLGTVPDLDVFVNPLLDSVQQLSFHRGPSHSILFALLAAPVFAWLFQRLHRSADVTFGRWSWFVFLCIVTHPLLDTLTNYGTQLFWPFSDYPATWATVGIIDPLYTLPLLAGVVVAMFMRSPAGRVRWNRLGLILSSAYLLFTMGNKINVDSAFSSALERQGIPYTSMMTTPTVLNNLLWNGFAENDTAVWAGVYSVLDEDRDIQFQHFSKRLDLVAGNLNDIPLQKLLWFSQGYFFLEEQGDTLYFNDLHVGRRDAFIGDSGAYIFRFRLQRNSPSDQTIGNFEQVAMSLDVDSATWDRFWTRMWGE